MTPAVTRATDPCAAPGTGGAAGTRSALDAVRRAPTILEAVRRADALSAAVEDDDPAEALAELSSAVRRPGDQVVSIAAVHALGALPTAEAGCELAGLLAGPLPHLREHAVWALGAHAPVPDAVAPLVGVLAEGGFPGMMAQRTLEAWARTAPRPVLGALEQGLAEQPDPPRRARLAETTGLVPGPGPERLLELLVLDPAEDPRTRATALEALAGRLHDDPAPRDAVEDLARRCAAAGGELGAVAGLVLEDAAHAALGPDPAGEPGHTGLTVVQPFLHAEIDHGLTRSGRGDNGGIATLLVHLGDALCAAPDSAPDRAPDSTPDGPPRVTRVVTVSRGDHDEARRALAGLGRDGHAFAPVPFLGEPVHSAVAWPRRVAAVRGVRRVLRRAGRVDAVHLRMADVGSMAAAEAARAEGVPVVLTMAPDPHALIAAREAAGTLTRDRFGAADHAEHLWFRLRLLADLEAQARHVVLFPRPALARDARDLLGVDLAALPGRHTVVPEGIDLRAVEEAAAQTAPGAGAPGPAAARALADLDGVLAGLPPSRRALPLLVTVGRLHRVKGTAALVRAWAGEPALRDRCNLLLVGGDLDRPTPDEREQLDLVDAVVPRADAASRGLLLAGHRPNGTVAVWLAAARRGRPGLAAGRGAYACASLKEEFGVALVEAMAAGLVVVAPRTGGPATFVQDGVTGLLVDTQDREALARGLTRALDLAAAPGADAVAGSARDLVRERFSIQVMASALTDVYAEVVRSRSAAAVRSPAP
jgi:glycosyltransferase involved in cell wall biosynthesis